MIFSSLGFFTSFRPFFLSLIFFSVFFLAVRFFNMSYLQTRTTWWDFLPPEIQHYILNLADRQHHRDQLRIVHEVLQQFWHICDCSPFHVLHQIHFTNKWRIACGMQNFLPSPHYKGSKPRFKYQLRCRK